jgi:hypothetical protein
MSIPALPNSGTNGDGQIGSPALTFEERMREAELNWKRAETAIREKELAQRSAEWEKAQAITEEDRRLAQEQEKHENGLFVRLGKAFVTSIPLLVAALTVFVGYHQFAQSQQAEAQAQVRAAQLNAESEEFKALLAAHQSFLQMRDKAYYDAVAAATNADAAYNIADPKFASLSQTFQNTNSAELTPVEEDSVRNAATLFSFCLIYLGDPKDVARYQAQIEMLWEQTHADHPDFPDHLDFGNKSQLIDTLDQNLLRIIKNAITHEDDPTQYPSISILADDLPHK